MSKMKKSTRQKVWIWSGAVLALAVALVVAAFVSYDFKQEKVAQPGSVDREAPVNS